MIRNKLSLGLLLCPAFLAWTSPAVAQSAASGLSGISSGSGTGLISTAGSGFLGGSGGGGSGRGGSGASAGSQVPSQNNPYLPNYNNPMYTGTPTKYNATTPARGGMGTPLFATVTTATAPAGPGISTSIGTPIGFNTQSIRRNTPYVAILSEDLPLVSRPLVKGDLQAILNGSTMLGPKTGIILDLQGPVVVLRGEVNSAKDRRLAEGLLRLTPGVRDVVNDLRVVTRSP